MLILLGSGESSAQSRDTLSPYQYETSDEAVASLIVEFMAMGPWDDDEAHRISFYREEESQTMTVETIVRSSEREFWEYGLAEVNDYDVGPGVNFSFRVDKIYSVEWLSGRRFVLGFAETNDKVEFAIRRDDTIRVQAYRP